MNLILKNPYRIVGLLVGATAKEQTKQISRLKKYIEAEQDPEDDFSFPALGDFHRNMESIEEAESKLNLDNDKINAALFWFWNGNPITDEAVFDALKDGNTDDAIEIWRKLIYNSEKELNEISKRNASAFFNLSSLYLIKYGINEETLQLKLRFLQSQYVKDFKSAAADDTFNIEKRELQLNFLNKLVNYNNIDYLELMEAISNIDFEGKQDFIEGIIQKLIKHIEEQLETAKNKRKASKSDAANTGQELVAKATNSITQLSKFIGSNELKFTSIVDKIANEILQCSIDYFNDSQEKDSTFNYAEIAMKLAKQAETLASGQLAKERIRDSLQTLEEMKDKELSQAIQLLTSVKDAYESNEQEIRAEVRRLEETDIQIKLGYKIINQGAVEDNIKNSIKWKEVNKLLISILTDHNLAKIKGSTKIQDKREFLELAHWLKEKSKSPSKIKEIIDKYKSIPPKLPFRIISSTVTNVDKNSKALVVTNPLYTKYTRYVGLKLSVVSSDNSRIVINKKYVKPNGKYASNDKDSPRGYTSSTDVNINLNTTVIDLSGWGNAERCTFDVGKHRIELYVDEYMIYTTEFTIDIAPSEKLEAKIIGAEMRLSEISSTVFFKSELETAKNEMSEIQKFQLFRSSSTKQSQIELQAKKISNINLRAETEKKYQIDRQKKLIEKLKSDLSKAEH